MWHGKKLHTESLHQVGTLILTETTGNRQVTTTGKEASR
jgi:hypothetical protein